MVRDGRVAEEHNGISSKILRYWETRGLLPKPKRTHTDYRLYPNTAVRRVQFILKAKSSGFTLSEIKWLFGVAKERGASCAAVNAWALCKLKALDHQIKVVTRLRNELRRNDLAIFEGKTVPDIRERLKAGDPPENCVRDGVAAFDSFIAQYAKQLAEHVPMTERRKYRLRKQSFHNLAELRNTFENWFDINPCAGMKDDECRSIAVMFYRRHVYEHNGGEVDQKYLDNSGDTTVVLKQHIHETQQAAHDLLSSLVKLARNVHASFHELFPPIPAAAKG